MKSKYKIENLSKLTKEQLIYLIEQYEDTNFLISDVLVEESKWHIAKDEAIRKIREYMLKGNVDLYNDSLSEFIDMKLGKISSDEYRRITLRIEDE